jgi:sugar phosphate permease
MRALDSLMRARRGLFYGWWVTLGGAASNFLVIGIVAFGFGVFVQPLRDEMGWSVAAISAGVSLRSAEQGLLAPLTGMLVDRVGPRRMAIGGMIMLVVGLVLFSQARSLTAFYVSSLVIALGQSTASFTPFSVAVVAWFRRMRGRRRA